MLILFLMKDKKVIFFIVLISAILILTGWSLNSLQNYKYLFYYWDGKNYQKRDDNNVCFNAKSAREEKADIDGNGKTERVFIKNNKAIHA